MDFFGKFISFVYINEVFCVYAMRYNYSSCQYIFGIALKSYAPFDILIQSEDNLQFLYYLCTSRDNQ